MEINRKFINDFENSIKNAKKIFISSHVGVDCDNLSSCLAIYSYLISLKKEAYLLKSDFIPESYNYLPFIEKFTDSEDVDIKDCDLYISLDSTDIDRLGDNKNIFLDAKTKIVIDHHATNIGYGDYNLIIPEASSTCEIIYNLFNSLEFKITKDIATILYSGISTDTGRLLYDNVSSNTFRVMANLKDLGANTKEINFNLFQSRPLAKVNILKLALNNMKIIKDKIAYTYVTTDMLKEANANLHDLDEIIEYIRDISGIEGAFLVKQYGENFYKVSLRSKKYIDVSKIASKFNGGGHIRAAGLTYYGTIEDIISLLTKEFTNAL